MGKEELEGYSMENRTLCGGAAGSGGTTVPSAMGADQTFSEAEGNAEVALREEERGEDPGGSRQVEEQRLFSHVASRVSARRSLRGKAQASVHSSQLHGIQSLAVGRQAHA